MAPPLSSLGGVPAKNVVVLDAGAILHGFHLHRSDCLYTTVEQVLQEIRDSNARRILGMALCG